MRRNCGSQYELGVAVGAHLWKVTFYLPASSWTHVAMTFNQTAGLKVYVDGQLEASDAAGSQRFYVQAEFDQFANMTVGQCNDLPLDPSSPGVAVWNLTHVDAVYSKADLLAMSGNRHARDRRT